MMAASKAVRLARNGQVMPITGRPARDRSVRSTAQHSRLPTMIWSTRRRAGLTGIEAARKIQAPPTTYFHWEEGSRLPRGHQIPRLARFLDIEPAALQLLIVAEKVDRLFRRGTATIEDLHRKILATMGEGVLLRRDGA